MIFIGKYMRLCINVWLIFLLLIPNNVMGEMKIQRNILLACEGKNMLSATGIFGLDFPLVV